MPLVVSMVRSILETRESSALTLTLPISSSSSARCACSRFSAWSTTTELGPSSTASSISTLRRTGRQCITMPLPPRVERSRVRREPPVAEAARAAPPPPRGWPNSFTDPHDFTYTASAPTSRLVGIVDDVDELAARAAGRAAG